MTKLLNWLTALALLASVLLRSPPLFLLAALLGLAAGVTALWHRYALAGVAYTRRLGATHLFVGEETDLQIEIVNAKPLPLAWLRVDDEFPSEVKLTRGRLHYSHKPRRRVLVNFFSLRFYERVRKSYHLQAVQRGELEFGPCELRSGDVFGFRAQAQELSRPDYLIVYPKVVPVAGLGLPAAHPFGEERAPRKLVEDPLRIAGVRPYVAGDSPRFVHWKATARRGSLQSKVFDPSAACVSAVFLDVRTVSEYPGLVPDYLELGVCAAASVARHLMDAGQAVGLYANGFVRRQGALIRLPPARRPEHWHAILESLARLDGLPIGALARYLRAERCTLPLGATVVAISACIDDELVAALLDARRAGHPVALLAVGNEAPPAIPDAVRTYWIGGQEAYRRLVELEVKPCCGS